MTFSIQFDKHSKDILAVYFKLHSGKVAKTVEIEEDACYADEDSEGRLLGVEMLAPGKVSLLTPKVSERYQTEELNEVLKQAEKVFA